MVLMAKDDAEISLGTQEALQSLQSHRLAINSMQKDKKKSFISYDT